MARALVILLALTIDLIWGDPPNQLHPVTWIGRWLSWGQRLAPQSHRFWFGASWTLAGMLLFTLPWWKVESKKQSILHPSSPWGLLYHLWPTPPPFAWKVAGHRRLHRGQALILHPFLLKPVFAYRNLRQAVLSVAEALALANLSEARRLLSWHLVSRNTSDLTEPEVIGAAIESLAENLTDSLAAPLLAYAGSGLFAAWAYRFINTADAMWGYRTLEFEQLGKFPARFDDVLNWLPARLTGWLLVIAAWLVGENTCGAVRTMLAQHQRTASPNAGWTISAMAGALGVTLSKRGVYEVEGGQQRLEITTISRAVRLADMCAGLVMVLSALIAIVAQVRVKK